MGIEDFKRWHWIVIGLLVGAVLAYTRMQMSPDEASVLRRGISPAEFIRDLQRPKTPNGFSWLNDVRVYPPFENKVVVTGNNLEIQANGKGVYKPFQLITDIPFKLAGAAPPPRSDFTIRDYIDQLKKNHPQIEYRFAWWTLPGAVAAIWGGGALLLIGGVWPFIVNLMIGAGLGRKKEKDPDYDLDRFKAGPEPAAAAKQKGLTVGDSEKLRELEEALQKNLAAGAAGADQPATTLIGAGSEPGVKKLDAGPLELAAAAQKKEEEDREYKGEFYPVARPAGHADAAKD
jgi:hypothetical protein